MLALTALALTATLLLATSSPILALPTTNSLGSLFNRQIAPLVASLPYPNSFDVGTCPLRIPPSGNPWAPGIEPHDKKKRSPISRTVNTRATPEEVLPCTMIANTFFDHWVSRVGNTRTRRLQAGVTYIFSFGCNVAIDWVQAYTSTGDGGFDKILHQDFSGPAGRVTMTVPTDQDVHFEVQFSRSLYYSGEFALFELPQGDLVQNILATGGGG
ncbi:hypothetical protein MMC21_002962 [Puttea exsequens]|nr:hypothetical protein [Puttea exsequens]